MSTPAADEPTSRVWLDEPNSQYRIALNGADAGFTEFADHGNQRVFIHTEIDPEYKGHGLGKQLIVAALDDARSRGLRIVALCPFVTAFLGRNHDYDDLLDRATPELLAAITGG
ncbi:MAG TPA: GNAT family N-acetyltransferase [Pseudonocardiaceae bacterium]|jgi:hypothetical protein|nr:GNAT family N-acetyltransferase [Pseudonocardiaceae bacterium]